MGLWTDGFLLPLFAIQILIGGCLRGEVGGEGNQLTRATRHTFQPCSAGGIDDPSAMPARVGLLPQELGARVFRSEEHAAQVDVPIVVLLMRYKKRGEGVENDVAKKGGKLEFLQLT